jgi:hypothetical protein
MTHDLGPLPKADRQDTLQQLSIKALRNLLPEDDFLFRDERVDDKGVDGAIEVKVDGSFTNCRSQVQLKSTDADPKTFNKDGSYSESIATANLNYLLNGTSPIYVVWLAKTNELRFAWAHDEWRRLDAEHPDWMKQDSYTIRFSKALTPVELPVIRDRILAEARLQRRIHESLARSTPAETVVVGINAKTLTSTDPNELHERLSKSGMTIVSSGYGKQALEWYGLVNPDAAKEPRLQLVAAFASFSIGKYHEAKGFLAAAVPHAAELSYDDQQFLEYLGGACDYHMGRIDRAEYLKMEMEWAGRLSGIRAVEHRLEVMRHERLAERNAMRRAELLSQMKGVVNEIESAREAIAAQKVQARLIVLAAEGDDLNTQFLEDLSRIGLRENMGFSAESMTVSVAQDTAARWTAWQRQAAALREEAVEVGHPLLIADAIVARARLFVSHLLLRRMNSIAQGGDEKPSQKIVDELKRDIEEAVEIYQFAGNLSGEYHIKMLLADLYEVCGMDDAARTLANEVLPTARAMNYDRVVSLATMHIEGRSELQQFAVRISERPTNDEIALSQTNEELREMAMLTIESLGIPGHRLALVEKDLQAGRFIAEQRRDWCCHIELHQDLTHTERAETAYATDPNRVCVCTKLGHKSRIENPDYFVVVDAFKKTYCDGCTHREVKAG